MACIGNIVFLHTETISTIFIARQWCVHYLRLIVSIGVAQWLLGSISLILEGILPCPSVASQAGRLLNALRFHIPCDIGLGSDYSTRGCELKIQGFVSYGVEMRLLCLQGQDCTCPSILSTRCRCVFSLRCGLSLWCFLHGWGQYVWHVVD